MTDTPTDAERIEAAYAALTGTPEPPASAPEKPVEEQQASEPVEGGADADNAADDAPEAAEVDPKRKGVPAEKRIAQITAARREAERERDAERTARQALEDKLKRIEPLLAQLEGAKPARTLEEGEPDPLDTKKYPLGTFDPAFDADRRAFDAERTRRLVAEQTAQVLAQREAAQNFYQTFDARVAAAAEKAPDIKEVFASVTPEDTKGLDQLFSETALDPDAPLVYYAWVKEGRLDHLRTLSPVQQGQEFAAAKSRIASGALTKDEQKPAKVSQSATISQPRATRGTDGRFAPNFDTNDFGSFEQAAKATILRK